MRQAIEDLESMKNQEPWTFHYLVLVVIFLMPIMLSPDYVHKGIKLGIKESPYVIAVLSSFLFGIAQIGVQIALDPLAYINEDDIELVGMPIQVFLVCFVCLSRDIDVKWVLLLLINLVLSTKLMV